MYVVGLCGPKWQKKNHSLRPSLLENNEDIATYVNFLGPFFFFFFLAIKDIYMPIYIHNFFPFKLVVSSSTLNTDSHSHISVQPFCPSIKGLAMQCFPIGKM